ncbi:hypothetical protein OTU49_001608, partial [Cherax quadricarinatus]
RVSPSVTSLEDVRLGIKEDEDSTDREDPLNLVSDRQQQLASHTPDSPSDITNLNKLSNDLRTEDLICSCGMKSISKKEHMEHVLTHVSGAFKCPQCQSSYTCSSRLALHQRLLHCADTPKERFQETVKSVLESNDEGSVCSKCGMLVGTDIEEHMKGHLYGENECPVCAVKLKTSHTMVIHFDRKHPHLLQAYLKTKDFLKENVEDEVSSNQLVKCDVCDKLVTTASKLARHRYLQHPEHYPWTCTNCSLAFPSPYTRDNHNCHFTRKSGQKNECCICHIVFKSNFSLQRHMRRAHPNEPSGHHTCPVCTRTLASRKAFTDHMRCHRRQQGFQCVFCNARLKTTDSLNVHLNEIHTHTVRLQCKQCPQVFFSSGRLSYHIKRHHTDRRSYTNLCHLCGKVYPYPSELKLHLRSHRNERPYKCNQCQKTFLKQGDLTYHKRTHTGIRPHKCPHCDARFPRPNTLMSHIRQQHRERKCNERCKVDASTSVTSEAPVSRAPVPSYVTSSPTTVVTASSAPYLATVNTPAVTVMSVEGVPRAQGEATLMPVVGGRLVEGQLVDAVVEGQVTEMQPVHYVQVDSLSASQPVQAAHQAVEGMEYDVTTSAPYQIVHLQILQ